MSPVASLLMLLLLGLAQAQQDMDEEFSGNDEETIDITTAILTTNNGTSELLMEGDMLLPQTRNALRCLSNSCLWRKSSNGLVTIPYILSPQFSGMERQKIERALQSFHGRSCIRFVPRRNEYDFISVENKGGCFAALGRQGGRQVVSLNRQGCIYHGIIQHEFLHALGFLHEQTRSDRDSYVRIIWQNIDPQMAFNFDKKNTNNLNTRYDYSSIMHYGRTAFSINGRDTIVPNSGANIGQRQGMSRIDITRLNILYGC
ncbi:high choriolytic enzyme 1-like [Entelurus aequoreus]|uniref:high choriolytic enzyme 1-like n=1 Tax=Entelurus aequoreus TaxID=161455 RepID=UPI002B1E8E07|nr:high choriolytic enzyme 1-like [Entelurus aequoreus]